MKFKDKVFAKYLDCQRIFIENRTPEFLVKKGEEENFKKAFNKEFGNDFYLLSKEEVLKLKIFGDDKHAFLESSIGDFMAFSNDSSNICLLGDDNSIKISYYGGNNDDEIYIPLIVISY